MKVAGIYKITSPSGKVYIGQSWDISSRWSEYRTKKAPSQHALRNSFLKYGVYAHSFDLLWGFHNPTQEEMDSTERLYMRIFKNDGIILLNIRDGGRGGKNSPETIEKMRKASSGRRHSEETKKKMATYRKGVKFPDEWRKNISSGQYKRTDCRGEKSHHAKLTEADVLEIRSIDFSNLSYYAKANTLAILINKYGVGKTAISSIINRKTWKHI